MASFATETDHSANLNLIASSCNKRRTRKEIHEQKQLPCPAEKLTISLSSHLYAHTNRPVRYIWHTALVAEETNMLLLEQCCKGFDILTYVNRFIELPLLNHKGGENSEQVHFLYWKSVF